MYKALDNRGEVTQQAQFSQRSSGQIQVLIISVLIAQTPSAVFVNVLNKFRSLSFIRRNMLDIDIYHASIMILRFEGSMNESFL